MPRSFATITSAQDAMIEFKLRAEECGNWCFNSDYQLKQAISDALNVHDLQCSSATERQIVEDLQMVRELTDQNSKEKLGLELTAYAADNRHS